MPTGPGRGRLVVAGCGTVVPEGDRACSCYYLELGAMRALLDCGSGAVQALARLGLPWSRLTHILLTHFHADHVGALAGLFFALKHGAEPPRRQEPLHVWGPVGTRRLFSALAEALGDFLLDPGFPLTVDEITPAASVSLGDVRLLSHKTPHTAESLALRLEWEGASVAYTGDTGPEGALADFAAATELLVCECSLPDELVGDNHLSPSSVAALAGAAGPRLLLLTHVYPRFREQEDVVDLVAAAGYGGRTELAHEGWSIRLGEGAGPPLT
jgi:ribonuclease BN (tRNA processing enzyme)